MNFPPIVERVDALDRALPQTQCRRCGYDDCRRYAFAIDAGEAATNRCPPGGAEGVRRLSLIAGTVAQTLDRACGTEGPRQLAVIDEDWCIGCALCLQACPVDAIVGAAKRMHTVIDVHCTGCELCVPVCPVDCISLVNVTGDRTGWNAWTTAEAETSQRRYTAHRDRGARPGDAGGDRAADGDAETSEVTCDATVAAVADADADADAGLVLDLAANVDRFLAGRGNKISPASDPEDSLTPVIDVDLTRRRAAVAAALARARARRGA